MNIPKINGSGGPLGQRPFTPKRPAVTSQLSQLFKMEKSPAVWDRYLELGADRRSFSKVLRTLGFVDPLLDLKGWAEALKDISTYATRVSVGNETAILVNIIEQRMLIESTKPVRVSDIASKEYGQNIMGLKTFFSNTRQIESSIFRSLANALIMHTLFSMSGLKSGFNVLNTEDGPIRIANWVDLDGEVKSIDWDEDQTEFGRISRKIEGRLSSIWPTQELQVMDQKDAADKIAADLSEMDAVFTPSLFANAAAKGPANEFFAADAFLRGRELQEKELFDEAALQYFICLDINPKDPYDLLMRLRQMKAL